MLAKAALSHCVEQQWKMKLSCWYLEGYAKKHPNPEVDKLLIK